MNISKRVHGSGLLVELDSVDAIHLETALWLYKNEQEKVLGSPDPDIERLHTAVEKLAEEAPY